MGSTRMGAVPTTARLSSCLYLLGGQGRIAAAYRVGEDTAALVRSARPGSTDDPTDQARAIRSRTLGHALAGVAESLCKMLSSESSAEVGFSNGGSMAMRR